MSRLSVLLLGVAVGCAGTPEPIVTPESADDPNPEVVVEQVLDTAPLDLARDLAGDGDRHAATLIADSPMPRAFAKAAFTGGAQPVGHVIPSTL